MCCYVAIHCKLFEFNKKFGHKVWLFVNNSAQESIGFAGSSRQKTITGRTFFIVMRCMQPFIVSCLSSIKNLGTKSGALC